MVQKAFEYQQIGSTVEHWKLGDRSWRKVSASPYTNSIVKP
jgi:hypothetical protein